MKIRTKDPEPPKAEVWGLLAKSSFIRPPLCADGCLSLTVALSSNSQPPTGSDNATLQIAGREGEWEEGEK
ncbi:hypothetical protein VZT92_015290 [Zoarces viviparus]|uniref:Uncharacterized protein n=1 Tax=Zoarces viviparus TaxID=48416 RepID=A0AAW1EVY5_ZOAVI